MSRLEAMIEQSLAWMREHKAARRPFDACTAAIRARALIDAYEIFGGDGRRWKKECGLFW